MDGLVPVTCVAYPQREYSEITPIADRRLQNAIVVLLISVLWVTAHAQR